MSTLPEWVIKKILRALRRKSWRGFMNDIIDVICHPWFGKTYGIAEIVDFILHAINEGRVRVDKFIIYNLNSLIYSIYKLAKRLSK